MFWYTTNFCLLQFTLKYVSRFAVNVYRVRLNNNLQKVTEYTHLAINDRTMSNELYLSTTKGYDLATDSHSLHHLLAINVGSVMKRYVLYCLHLV